MFCSFARYSDSLSRFSCSAELEAEDRWRLAALAKPYCWPQAIHHFSAAIERSSYGLILTFVHSYFLPTRYFTWKPSPLARSEDLVHSRFHRIGSLRFGSP